MKEKESEPPSTNAPIILIGRNSRGAWVAQEKNGLFGGLFVSRADAIRYALFENGRDPSSIVEAAAPIELDMSRSPWSKAGPVRQAA